MTADVYKFPFCCRKRMVYQPSRLRFYCQFCGKLMERGAQFTPSVEIATGPVALTSEWPLGS